MNYSLDDLLRSVPAQNGNRGRRLVPKGLFKEVPAAPTTPIDKTTAAAKLILDDEATARATKTARLKAAREARDQKKSR